MRSATVKDVFNALDTTGAGTITAQQIAAGLRQAGIPDDDPRIESLQCSLQAADANEDIGLHQFAAMTAPCFTLVERAVKQEFVIPAFASFSTQVAEVFEQVSKLQTGQIADYIPQLAKVAPDQFGMAICTVDGQRFSIGDAGVSFCLQSTCKPVLYCAALKQDGEDQVHQHVGREPSGRSFNDLALNPANLPHNPMINAGAIMCASLLQADQPMADRCDHLVDLITELSAGNKPGFNNAVYHSERSTADRNFALAHYMREVGAFADGVDIKETLDLYFAACSMELNCNDMATMAATLANSGVCPQTGHAVFSDDTVKNGLSMMYSCGMYDYSGEFAFRVGIPAKSGVSGAIMAVIPNVMGIAVWSPRLDALGNSVRGVGFLTELVNRFNFHNYDSLVNSTKLDPRQCKPSMNSHAVYSAIEAASNGDVDELKRLVGFGIDLNNADYDGRTPLHLAAAEGRLEAVRFLINKGVAIQPRDRWENTPLNDARRHGQGPVVELLEQRIGIHAVSKAEPRRGKITQFARAPRTDTPPWNRPNAKAFG